MSTALKLRGRADRAALRRAKALHGNPIAKAVKTRIAAVAQAEFEDQLRTTRIKVLMAADGEDATELLACLAVVIGTPCEAGARQFGREVPWIRHLHGALRTIQRMCLDGSKWKAISALGLDRAMEVAAAHKDDLEEKLFSQAWVEANGFAGAILRHEVRADSVVGGAA